MNVKDITNLKRIWAFEKDFAVIETTDNKSGIINRQGEVILDPKDYDMALQTEDGLFALDKFDEQGISHRIYFNAYTREIIPHDIINLRGTYYVEVVNNLYGLCDYNYQSVLPAEYNGLVEWNGNYMALKDGKWGLITATGDILLPFQYDDCTFAPGQYHSRSYQCVAKDGEYFYINQEGNRISQCYEYLEPLTDLGLAIMKRNGYYGLIDRDENIILTTSITGENTKNLDERTFYWCGYHRLAFRQNGLLGIMDTQGKMIVAPQYTWVKNFYKSSDQKISVKDTDGRAGMIDLNGRIIIPCEYSYVGYYQPTQTHTVHVKNGKWGLLDAQGQTILPVIYDAVNVHETYGLNEIAVSKDGRCYFINAQQQEVQVF